MLFKVVKLTFKSPITINKGLGEIDSSYESIASDSLKSALFVAGKLLNDQLESVKFFESFLISSAFPFFENEFFFPKPFTRIQTFLDLDLNKQGKPLKKIKWISKGFFEDVLHGANKKIDFKTNLSENGEYVCEKPDVLFSNKKRPIVHEIRQRVYIGNDYNSSPQPFYMERIHFEKGAGLYCLIIEKTAGIIESLMPAFKILGEQGIGTDRNVGNGQFEASLHEMDLIVPENGTHDLCLSMYCPEMAEIKNEQLQHASYQLTKRGGFISSPENQEHITLRKKSVYMFTEGSVFPRDIQRTGKIVNLKPEFQGFSHPVWREGRAIFVPLIQNNNE